MLLFRRGQHPLAGVISRATITVAGRRAEEMLNRRGLLLLPPSFAAWPFPNGPAR